MKRLFFLVLFATLSCVAWASVAWAQTTYSVRFDSEWSAATHPTSFPPNPHMSPLIGGTHNASYSMWAPGELARSGMETMAETGATALLRSEVDARIGFGSASSVISGGGIGTSPGSVETTFEIVGSHPLVSLVSMIAPSPDWFVGVHGLSLVDNGEWISSLTVDLFPYDSGTDSGTGYTSANADTDPAETIHTLTGSPFLVNNQLVRIGTFTFTCQAGCGAVVTETEQVVPQEFAVGLPYPNPASSSVTVPVTSASSAPVRVDVMNVLGQIALSEIFAAGSGKAIEMRLPVDRLSAGTWFIRVSGSEGVSTRQITVTR